MTTTPLWLDDLLRCPDCRAGLRRDANRLECTGGHRFSIEAGYADLWRPIDVPSARTAESFGYEWNAFDAEHDEDASFWASHARDLDLGGLQDVDALDAGCGKGRYTRFLAPNVRHLVALDASSAVRAAARNLGPLGNVAVVRADLRDVPFDEGSFGLVTSIGVLHHLADPERAFRSLAGLVAPGGVMFVYLYSRPTRWGVRALGLSAARVMRRVTTHLPHRMLRWLAVPVAGALWVAFVAPGHLGERVGVAPLASLPMHTYRRKPFRAIWLDTFDRLSAPIEHRFTWEELRPWFERADLAVESVWEDAGYYVVARRPR